jgi:hypothetical protein
MALTMGLKTKSPPNPMHGRSRQLSVPGHRPIGPMGSILWFGTNGLSNQHGHFSIRNRSWTTGPQFIVEPRQALAQIRLPPLSYHLGTDADSFANGPIGQAIFRNQHDAYAPHQTMRQRSRIQNAAELFPFLQRQYNRLSWPACSHGLPPLPGCFGLSVGFRSGFTAGCAGYIIGVET